MSPWENQQAGVSELAPPDGPLVSVPDYAEWHKVDVTGDEARIGSCLEVASALVREACNGRWFTPMEDTELTVDGPGGRLLILPAQILPVRAITAITEDAAELDVDADIHWSTDGLVRFATDRCWTSRYQGITITASHGYVVVPRSVEGVVLGLAKRLADSPDGQRIQQETIGAVSYTYGGGGGPGLTELELRALTRYGGR